MNKPKSNIQKGKRFEDFICQEIETMGLGAARREIGSGSGKKKGDIFANLPFLLEAKNQKKGVFQLWKSIDQAKGQADIGNLDKDKWALVVRDPNYGEFQRVYAVIDFWQFLSLLKKDAAPLVQAPDREMKFHLSRMKENINHVLKYLS